MLVLCEVLIQKISGIIKFSQWIYNTNLLKEKVCRSKSMYKTAGGFYLHYIEHWFSLKQFCWVHYCISYTFILLNLKIIFNDIFVLYAQKFSLSLYISTIVSNL